MRHLWKLVLFSAILASAQNSKEAALGNQMMQELGRRWKIVDAPEHMADIVQKLPLTAQGPITVKVVESDQALANTLPGGIVYVSTAVLKAAEPTELAGILTHEVAHVVARHVAIIPSERSIPIVFMGGLAGICTRMTEPGSIVWPKSYEARGAANEVGADSLAAGYLRNAGYDMTDLGSVFAKVRSIHPPRKAPTLIR
jgi:predicted Zn-dependent protease